MSNSAANVKSVLIYKLLINKPYKYTQFSISQPYLPVYADVLFSNVDKLYNTVHRS